MRTSELRVGNYVNVMREDQSPFKIDFFEYLNESDCKIAKRQFIGNSEVHPLTWYFNDLSPIKLTDEWILKLGYIAIDPIFSDRPTIFTKGIHKIWHPFDQFLDDVYRFEIKYVHKLQNLYFALTGEELTIQN